MLHHIRPVAMLPRFGWHDKPAKRLPKKAAESPNFAAVLRPARDPGSTRCGLSRCASPRVTRISSTISTHISLGLNHLRASRALWFETRGVAALLTMRVPEEPRIARRLEG